MYYYKSLIFLCFSLFILNEIAKYFLQFNNLIYDTLLEQFTYQQVDEIFMNMRLWQYIGYLLIPLLITIKVYMISKCLDLGSYIFSKEIKFKKIFNIVVKAEFIFLLVIVLKTVWFYFFKQDYSLQDLQYFYPLSLLNIIGYDGLVPWYIYPLQVVNLFEVAYWILLAYLLDNELNTPKNEHTGIKIVASSYGVGLLIWVVGVMFFTLSMS